MLGEERENSPAEKKIIINKNGPYEVCGGIPLVRKTQVVSEYGEPLTWQKIETIETEETYLLCRCGHSTDKPFCTGAHCKAHFDGTETADMGPTTDRQRVGAGHRIIVKRDFSLCAQSGFCGNRLTNIARMLSQTEEPAVRAQIMAMIERCPSGSYVYALEEDGPDIEPDLPQQIAVTIEITSSGPIPGPLWVTGGIPIERSDGQPMETRNRVTLCCCGKSQNKPFCDGSHRPEE